MCQEWFLSLYMFQPTNISKWFLTIVCHYFILPAQMEKNLPSMQETRVWSLGWEDPLEKGMAIHSSIFAWRIPWTEKPGWLQFAGLQRVGQDWVTNTYTHSLTDSYAYYWHRCHLCYSQLRNLQGCCVAGLQVWRVLPWTGNLPGTVQTRCSA